VNDITQDVINNILARLKKSDPVIYAAILRKYKPAQQMAGMGTLMDDFGTAFSSVLDKAGDLYAQKFQADIASSNAKQIAQQEIAKGQQQLDAMRLQAQNQYTMMQAAQQQQELAAMQESLQADSRNKMLLAAAAGLGVVLFISMSRRAGK
jgi:ABC-type amino acid transport substrate-binding protein